VLKPLSGARGSSADAGSCAELVLAPVMPEREEATAQLIAAPTLRVLIDHAAVTGTARLASGAHLVEVQTTDGQPRTAVTLKFDAWRPALLLADDLPKAGATLLFLGATCESCAPSTAPVVLTPRAGTRGSSTAAAEALRRGDWAAAVTELRGLDKKSRSAPGYALLASAVLTAAGDERQARAVLGPMTTAPEGVRDFLVVESSMNRRGQEQLLSRWNLLTERFSRLTLAAGAQANAPVAAASARFAELSKGFNEALKVADLPAQAAVVRTGDETLRVFLKAVRASRPGDCGFQAQLAASLQ